MVVEYQIANDNRYETGAINFIPPHIVNGMNAGSILVSLL